MDDPICLRHVRPWEQGGGHASCASDMPSEVQAGGLRGPASRPGRLSPGCRPLSKRPPRAHGHRPEVLPASLLSRGSRSRKHRGGMTPALRPAGSECGPRGAEVLP